MVGYMFRPYQLVIIRLGYYKETVTAVIMVGWDLILFQKFLSGHLCKSSKFSCHKCQVINR